MKEEFFYIDNKMTPRLEDFLHQFHSFDEFEARFSEEYLKEDCRVGNYLRDLIYKYAGFDAKLSRISFDAHLAHSYVGNIYNYKKNNPSRDALICICFILGTTEKELDYLLKYAGHAALYVRRKRDVRIWYGIMQKEPLEIVNDDLIARGMKPLYDPEK